MNTRKQESWHVERPYGEPGVYISSSDTSLVAKVYDEHEGKASLIAAAPDLLNACEDMLSRYIELFNSAGFGRGEDSEGAEILRQAIAKAKGE